MKATGSLAVTETMLCGKRWEGEGDRKSGCDRSLAVTEAMLCGSDLFIVGRNTSLLSPSLIAAVFSRDLINLPAFCNVFI